MKLFVPVNVLFDDNKLVLPDRLFNCCCILLVTLSKAYNSDGCMVPNPLILISPFNTNVSNDKTSLF